MWRIGDVEDLPAEWLTAHHTLLGQLFQRGGRERHRQRDQTSPEWRGTSDRCRAILRYAILNTPPCLDKITHRATISAAVAKR